MMMLRSILALSLAATALSLPGCRHAYQEVKLGQIAARPTLQTDATVFVALPADARFKNAPVVNSGRLAAVTVRSAFAKYVKAAYLGRRLEGFQENLEAARQSRCRYLVYPSLLRWEDRLTEYTTIRDKLEIKIDVADTASGAILHSSVLKGKSRVFTDGDDSPKDLLEEPIRNFVASLFRPEYTPSALR